MNISLTICHSYLQVIDDDYSMSIIYDPILVQINIILPLAYY